LRIIKKFAKNVRKNTSKRKTSTGHAALIKVNGEAKCGGAAVKM